MHDLQELQDAVFAAVETRNLGRAALLMTEFEDVFPEYAERLRAELREEYPQYYK